MDSLKAIQTLATIGRVLSSIVFAFCIVGGCLCIIGILGLVFGLDGLQLGDVTIQNIVETSESINEPTLYAALGSGLLFCVTEAVLSKFAELYFKHELEDGDPFTLRGSKELMRLGILTIAIPLGTLIVCSIALSIADNYYPIKEVLATNEWSMVGLGVGMLLTALFFRYGAETKGESL